MRLREHLETRVIKTAEKELGVPIEYDMNPIAVREIMEPDIRPSLDNQLERCHNVSFLYKYSVVPGYTVPESMDGIELRWFESLPDDLLKVHIDLYGDIIKNYFDGGTTR